MAFTKVCSLTWDGNQKAYIGMVNGVVVRLEPSKEIKSDKSPGFQLYYGEIDTPIWQNTSKKTGEPFWSGRMGNITNWIFTDKKDKRVKNLNWSKSQKKGNGQSKQQSSFAPGETAAQPPPLPPEPRDTSDDFENNDDDIPF